MTCVISCCLFLALSFSSYISSHIQDLFADTLMECTSSLHSLGVIHNARTLSSILVCRGIGLCHLFLLSLAPCLLIRRFSSAIDCPFATTFSWYNCDIPSVFSHCSTQMPADSSRLALSTMAKPDMCQSLARMQRFEPNLLMTSLFCSPSFSRNFFCSFSRILFFCSFSKTDLRACVLLSLAGTDIK